MVVSSAKHAARRIAFVGVPWKAIPLDAREVRPCVLAIEGWLVVVALAVHVPGFMPQHFIRT